MINQNGTLKNPSTPLFSNQNRGFKYGDAVFETMKVLAGKIVSSENHYFRLMASMRILRMEIPMNFTLDFFESEVKKTLVANDLSDARVRLTISRKDGGLYTPLSNEIDFIIEVSELKQQPFLKNYEIELFNDHYINAGLLSTLKTTNRIINVLASIYAKENHFSNCVLLNEKKNVVEFMNGNIFLYKDEKLITPPLADGCIKGIVRAKIIDYFKKNKTYKCEESNISPFDLHKAEEIFVTNTITGIQPVTIFRKTTYKNSFSKYLSEEVLPLLT
jgi:branched-chain amino acid aminotransferase